eukprot:TRINITY_DN74965_c0_g1_i1.p1 TRINITY_DN74965_c0_g1~~TRINITY_DN74965_c0_g1_i1.p1  ORF type:complete len:352 (-),score=29.37 TRINITY_DN74965_c0_g1_i1:83-1138(-)
MLWSLLLRCYAFLLASFAQARRLRLDAKHRGASDDDAAPVFARAGVLGNRARLAALAARSFPDLVLRESVGASAGRTFTTHAKTAKALGVSTLSQKVSDGHSTNLQELTAQKQVRDIPHEVPGITVVEAGKKLMHGSKYRFRSALGELRKTPSGPAFFADQEVYSRVVAKFSLYSDDNPRYELISETAPVYEIHYYKTRSDMMFLTFSSTFEVTRWCAHMINHGSLPIEVKKSLRKLKGYKQWRLHEALKGTTQELKWTFDLDSPAAILFKDTIEALKLHGEFKDLQMRFHTQDQPVSIHGEFVNRIAGYINTFHSIGHEYILLDPASSLDLLCSRRFRVNETDSSTSCPS